MMTWKMDEGTTTVLKPNLKQQQPAASVESHTAAKLEEG